MRPQAHYLLAERCLLNPHANGDHFWRLPFALFYDQRHRLVALALLRIYRYRIPGGPGNNVKRARIGQLRRWSGDVLHL